MATISADELFSINFTGTNREEEYKLSIKHGVVASSHAYWTSDKCNLLTLTVRTQVITHKDAYWAPNRVNLKNVTIAHITKITQEKPDEYINEGGMTGSYYIHFKPIIKMTEQGWNTSNVNTYVKLCNQNNTDVQKFMFHYTIDFQLERMCIDHSNDYRVCEVVYSNWFKQNRTYDRKLAYKIALGFIWRMWSHRKWLTGITFTDTDLTGCFNTTLWNEISRNGRYLSL